MAKGATQIKEWKKKKVDNFSKLMDESKIVGIVNLQNLPARQLQNMREQLRETVTLKMTKKRLVRLALKDSKRKNIGDLEPYMKGMPAMLFSDENPFKLFNKLKKNKSKAPIKAGQEAPNDIVIPAGPTDFPPGPIIGELGSIGIPTSVEGGKVAVKKDTVVAKEGTVVNEKVAGLLSRLGIEPMEVGLDLVVVYEEGELLTKKVLDIDVDAYRSNLMTAAGWAFNLAFTAGYPTKDNISLMIVKSHSDALALANSEDILTDETVKNVLAKAERQMKSLESKVDFGSSPEKKEEAEKTEEKKESEEKPAEGSEAGNEAKRESTDEAKTEESKGSEEKASE